MHMLDASDILTLALLCAPSVDPGTVLAITQRESARNPFEIGTGKAATLSSRPQTKAHALHVAQVLDKANLDFDVGLAQINRRNLRKFGFSVEQALDPCTNLQLMQRVLVDGYQMAIRQGNAAGAQASLAALSVYNTGSTTAGLKNGYVNGIVRAHPANQRRRNPPEGAK